MRLGSEHRAIPLYAEEIKVKSDGSTPDSAIDLAQSYVHLGHSPYSCLSAISIFYRVIEGDNEPTFDPGFGGGLSVSLLF